MIYCRDSPRYDRRSKSSYIRRIDEDVIVIDNEVQRWWIHYRRICLSIMKNQFEFDTATPATNIEVIESEI